MAKKRSQYSADFKFRLALEAAKGQHTLNELASQHGVHPNQIGQWKRQLLESGPDIFNGQTLVRQQKSQQTRGKLSSMSKSVDSRRYIHKPQKALDLSPACGHSPKETERD
jgi:transposase